MPAVDKVAMLHVLSTQLEMIMKRVTIALAATLMLIYGSLASAQETLLDYLVEACETDLQQYCSQVTPGEGRLLHCMAAHEDKISGRCEYAFYQAATLLEQLSAAVTYVATECKTDIETHCSEIEAGEGRILSCLEQHESQVSESCKSAIADTVGEE